MICLALTEQCTACSVSVMMHLQGASALSVFTVSSWCAAKKPEGIAVIEHSPWIQRWWW